MERIFRRAEHTADVAVEVFGKTFRELLEHSIVAYFELVTDRDCVRPTKTLRFKLEADTKEDLLYQLLREIHYRQAAEGWLAQGIRLRIIRSKPLSIEVEIEGEKYRPERHELKDEIKAVTLHALKVRRMPAAPSWRRWSAFVVFDV